MINVRKRLSTEPFQAGYKLTTCAGENINIVLKEPHGLSEIVKREKMARFWRCKIQRKATLLVTII
jgi:hypothetical protein